MKGSKARPVINDALLKIRNLIPQAVLIAVAKGTKKPIRRAWTALTAECMGDPRYLATLNHGANIGVLLGEASAGLVTFDIDTQAEYAELLRLNAWIKDTLITKRIRGGNFWIQLTDSVYPTSRKLLRPDGTTFGEFRSTGSMTIISGSALDKKRGETKPTAYRFINEDRPIECSLIEIKLPHDFKLAPPSPSTSSEFCDLSPVSCGPKSLCPESLCDTTQEILTRISAHKAGQDELQRRFPDLADLYHKFIEPRFSALPRQRNAFVVQSMTFLYTVVAPPIALELSRLYYQVHQCLFLDSIDDHMRESQAMIALVAETYVNQLEGNERQVYLALAEQEQCVFRICRDLARLPEPERPVLTFFMSCKELGDRMQIDRRVAHRILKRFEDDYGLLKCIERGRLWKVGERPLASHYRWMPATKQGSVASSSRGMLS